MSFFLKKKKEQAVDIGYESDMLDLIHRFFKVAIKFNELKEISLKEIKESMMTVSYQIQNIIKEIEIIKKGTSWKF